ncbi:MAG: hypothetical protein ACKV0T_17510 [Planctomycetales bacterium]
MMDKLKQIQKYQFWIILGLAVILPLVGWVMARSGLISEAEARTKSLNDIKTNLNAKPDDPNAEWEQRLTAINTIQKREVDAAWADLYERQLPRMIWPKNIDPARMENENQRAEQLDLYRTSYERELAAVRRIVSPLDDEGANGLVELPDAILPHPELEWEANRRPPTVKQVEAAQEDLWLLASLLKAIAEVNRSTGATTQLDAPIREVTELVLRGGSVGGASKAAKGPANAQAGGGTGGGNNAASDMMSKMAKGIAGSITSGNDSSSGGIDLNISFNPDDELGPEVPVKEDKTAAKKSPGNSQVGGGSTGNNAASDMMSKTAGSIGASINGNDSRRGGGSNMERYLENKPQYRTRGFYMELVMDHRRVPDLLVALSNTDWPLKIARVQQADYKDEELATEDSLGTMAGSVRGGAPGMGVGSAPGMAVGGAPGMGIGSAPGMGGAGAKGAKGSAPGGMPVGGMPGGATGGGAKSKARSNRALDDEEGGAAEFQQPSVSAFDDPMLARVSLDGWFTIFNKPTAEPAKGTPGTGGNGGNGTQPPATTGGTSPAQAAAGTPEAAVEVAGDEEAASPDAPAASETEMEAEGAAAEASESSESDDSGDAEAATDSAEN